MSGKKLILTQKQLDEITGGVDFSYLDGLASGDPGDIYANQVSADGGMETNKYPKKPLTTDDYADTMTRDAWPRDSRSYGKNGNYIPQNLYEMSKKEWEEKKLKEAKEHGNKRLNNRVFGDTEHQFGYDAVKQKEYRERQAAKKAINGSTPAEKQEGMKSLSRIRKNNGVSYQKAKKQFEPAKVADKQMQSMKQPGTKIESKPKIGKEGAHSPQNGIITPLK